MPNGALGQYNHPIHTSKDANRAMTSMGWALYINNYTVHECRFVGSSWWSISLRKNTWEEAMNSQNRHIQ